MRESDQWPYLTTSDILLYGDCAVLEEVYTLTLTHKLFTWLAVHPGDGVS